MRYNLFIELTSCNDLLIHLVLLLEYVFFFLHYSNLPSTSFKFCSDIIYVPTGIAMCNLNKYMFVEFFKKDKLSKIAYPTHFRSIKNTDYFIILMLQSNDIPKFLQQFEKYFLILIHTDASNVELYFIPCMLAVIRWLYRI